MKGKKMISYGKTIELLKEQIDYLNKHDLEQEIQINRLRDLISTLNKDIEIRDSRICSLRDGNSFLLKNQERLMMNCLHDMEIIKIYRENNLKLTREAIKARKDCNYSLAK